MKRLLPILFIATVLHAAPALAQQEAGDVELQLAGSIFTSVGEETSNTAGLFQAKFGYFFTDRVELGAYPSLTVTTVRTVDTWGNTRTATDSRVGLGVFGVYSFLAQDATTVPYLGAQYYISDITNASSRGWVGLNGGSKFYLSSRVAFDVGGNYLLALNDVSRSFVLFQIGISYLW